jgi:virginiamycin B lyase
MGPIGKRSLSLSAGICLLLPLLLMTGCVSGNSVTIEHHQLVQMYTLPSLGEEVFSLVSGPDKNVWVSALDDSDGTTPAHILRITPSGSVKDYQIPLPSAVGNKPTLGLVAGSDGNTWFTVYDSGIIGRITPSGAVQKYVLPAGSQLQFYPPVLGSDGYLWFIDSAGHYGKISPKGTITEYPSLAPGTAADTPLLCADGAMWFPLYPQAYSRALGFLRVTTDGVATLYSPTQVQSGDSCPYRSADGALWAVGGNTLVRTDAQGNHQAFTIHTSSPLKLINGLDGTLWFYGPYLLGEIMPNGQPMVLARQPQQGVPWNDLVAGPSSTFWFSSPDFVEVGSIYRLTTAGVVTEFDNPANDSIKQVIPGPDQHIWFSEGHVAQVGRVTV